MELLKQRIIRDGVVKPGNILKVDNFLNHQIDVALLNEMGKEWKRLFEGEKITKILTIEASGIGIACIAAQYFDVPVVFAKKSKTLNVDNDLYIAEVTSFTRKTVNSIIVSKKYLSPDDHILIIDDFLASGSALLGLIDIVKQAGATLTGAGIAIEKGFQEGGKQVRDMGIHLESLAVIESMNDGILVFRD